MIKLIFSYIKHQSIQFKILLGFSVLLFFAAIGYALKLSYSNYLLVQFQKEKIKELEKELIVSEEKTTKIISKGKTKTINVKKRQVDIDKKLKQDEKIIDNDSVSDDELRKFLTNHQKR
jgi:hypothetical protein